jgi:hypothetical protein
MSREEWDRLLPQRYRDGKSRAEIAQEFDCAEKTVACHESRLGLKRRNENHRYLLSIHWWKKQRDAVAEQGYLGAKSFAEKHIMEFLLEGPRTAREIADKFNYSYGRHNSRLIMRLNDMVDRRLLVRRKVPRDCGSRNMSGVRNLYILNPHIAKHIRDSQQQLES